MNGPHLTERISANIAHRYQIKTAPATTGTLYTPMESRRGIDDGVRKRMKEERRQRRLKKKER